METVLVQLNHSKAYQLIKDLESLNIIKILHRSEKTSKSKVLKKPSDYAGVLSKEDGEKMLADIYKSRSEWERSI